MTIDQAEAYRRHIVRRFGRELGIKASDELCRVLCVSDALASTRLTAVVEFQPLPIPALAQIQEQLVWSGTEHVEADRFRPEIERHLRTSMRMMQIREVKDQFERVSGAIRDRLARATVAGQSSDNSRDRVRIVSAWLNQSIRASVDVGVLAEIAGTPSIEVFDCERTLTREVTGTSELLGAPSHRHRSSQIGKGVIVALLDGEVELEHPALRDRVMHKGNYTRESWGCPDHHATAIAGIIAADGDVTGIAPGVMIYNYKVAIEGDTDSDTDVNFAAALGQAVEDGAQVANCSLGIRFATDGKSRAARAVDNAWAFGVTVVKSAGNNGPTLHTITVPGDADGVIVVGATNRAGTRVESFSSRGPLVSGQSRPHLVAPGCQGIVSCTSGGGTGECDRGTSFAASHVTGLVALLSGAEPLLTPDELRQRVMNMCRKLDGFDTNAQGAGLPVLP
jgi:serine protease AprX